ncbi:MAG TPA: oxygenase MpaB family protein [Candidatus Lumbricidophila sp.]|nr:oxygenase MpaB family protein [Candidatus Lumbricidophila sp.]
MGVSESDLQIFRRHAADGTLILGGLAAILLQLADPRVARGVARHSDFATRPLDRLFGTLDFVYAVGFADDAVVARVVSRVHRLHARVAGSDPPAYSADDADAQRWVASTLCFAALAVQREVLPPLSAADADAVVRAYAMFGDALRAESAGWPATASEFDAWWGERLAGVHVTDEAQDVARSLLGGAGLPWHLRLLLPPIRLVTAELLPADIAAAFGLRRTRRARRAARGWLRCIRALHPLLPRRLREAPLRAALQRVAT